MTRSGLSAGSKSVVEMIYAMEWNVPEIAQKVTRSIEDTKQTITPADLYSGSEALVFPFRPPYKLAPNYFDVGPKYKTVVPALRECQ